MSTTKMYGPAFDGSGKLVERDVPDVDVPAYRDAGYALGGLPAEIKAATAALLRGHLPDGFPGKDVLEAADLTTYAKLRHTIEKDPDGWYADIKGVGEKLAAKIAEAVGAQAEVEEEKE